MCPEHIFEKKKTNKMLSHSLGPAMNEFEYCERRRHIRPTCAIQQPVDDLHLTGAVAANVFLVLLNQNLLHFIPSLRAYHRPNTHTMTDRIFDFDFFFTFDPSPVPTSFACGNSNAVNGLSVLLSPSGTFS